LSDVQTCIPSASNKAKKTRVAFIE
jgi:hypothetical protein